MWRWDRVLGGGMVMVLVWDWGRACIRCGVEGTGSMCGSGVGGVGRVLGCNSILWVCVIVRAIAESAAVLLAGKVHVLWVV